MRLVIDANIVLSCLIANGISDLIFSQKLDLIAPELLFDEIHKHKSEIQTKSRLSASDLDILLFLLEKQIRIIPFLEFSSQFKKAEALLEEHRKDSVYIALALHTGCPIWTYEKRFAGIKGVSVIDTKGIRDYINT